MKIISLLLAALITTTGISSSETNNVQTENSIDKEKAAELLSFFTNCYKFIIIISKLPKSMHFLHIK